MSNSTTTTVYVHVIEDVVTKIRDEFINNAGPGEGVLNQLQGVSHFPQFSILYSYSFDFIS